MPSTCHAIEFIMSAGVHKLLIHLHTCSKGARNLGAAQRPRAAKALLDTGSASAADMQPQDALCLSRADFWIVTGS